VLSVDYRLAPEHPHPAAVEDATAAYRFLLDTGISPGNLAIGGDSAGGGLTVACLIALRDAGLPLPAAGVCISPWVDLTQSGESMDSKADEDPMVSREALQVMANAYLGGGDPKEATASPLFADLAGLPPLLIQVGTAETLLDDATRLAERAKSQGVDVTLEAWEEMIHVWHAFAVLLPEGRQAIERIGEFLSERLEA
jgi:monoterpene epsilon-lactone hydrolase